MKSKVLGLILLMLVSILVISGCSDEIAVKEPVNASKALDENQENKATDKEASSYNVEPVDTGLEEEELTEGDGMTVEGPYRDTNGLELSQVYGDGEYIFRLPNDDNNFKIFYKKDNLEEKVYYTVEDERHDDIIEHRFISQFYVKDNDNDGIEELYLFFEDFFEIQKILVLIPINDSHQLHSAFFGYGDSMFEYEHVNEDAAADLISPHPGGGGTTTTWRGLDLVNVYNPENLNYEFSYKMTRKRYEDRYRELTLQLQNHVSPENWEVVLEIEADLGLVKECEERIEKGKALEEFNVHSDWQGPYDTYFEYVIARAKEYKGVWEDLKEQDVTEKDTDQSTLTGPLTEEDFTLSNDLHKGMTFGEFQDIFKYTEGLEFPAEEGGFSSNMASVEHDGMKIIFTRLNVNDPDAVVFGYVVTDSKIKTKRGASVGMTSDEIIALYGDAPESFDEMHIIYTLNQNKLIFELEDGKVIKYRFETQP